MADGQIRLGDQPPVAETDVKARKWELQQRSHCRYVRQNAHCEKRESLSSRFQFQRRSTHLTKLVGHAPIPRLNGGPWLQLHQSNNLKRK